MWRDLHFPSVPIGKSLTCMRDCQPDNIFMPYPPPPRFDVHSLVEDYKANKVLDFDQTISAKPMGLYLNIRRFDQ